ncbi:polyamine deacetylase HDAC10 isoform X2 [Scleropages formosus]|uniref:polyamine deacetylase HDAC10 isoform X2 n=1 Tax=Scleropages formosus TaxID=113540 RepID=UPI0010FA7E0D|nr:polyamine deacetylase HDAC10 isoform X2 [Scleropages formosus]
MASGTALLYDEEMTRYQLLWDYPACKIESPERLTVSHEALQTTGLSGRCVSLPVRQATEDEILLAHSQEYLESVKKTPSMSLEELVTFTQQYGDVYFHPNIYHCAKLAIGATLQLVDAVMTGKVRNGMALVRPPGHHSQRSLASGFCVFNNVAIAALYAKKHFNVRRVLIVDWDIHHGQGLQYCFEEDSEVLYFSWHRYEHQRFWPNLRESDFDAVGKGKGAGFNINLPWNKVGMGNSDYLSVFFHVLLPIAYEFNPELVLVSAGFDSAIGDPEGHMCATPDIFGHLTHLLMSLASGRLCAILEGGYNLTSLAQSVCQTVQTLLGDPPSRISGLSSPCQSALESIHCVRGAHQQYWTCLKYADVGPQLEASTKCPRLEGVIGEADEEGTQAEEAQKEGEIKEIAWPEPPSRMAPPVRTGVVLPTGLEDHVPASCLRVTTIPLTSTEAAKGLSDPADPKLKDDKVLQSLGGVSSLLEKIEKKEVRNGLAVVPDLSLAVAFGVQQALTSFTDRVLLVFLGSNPPIELQEDGRVMLIQFCCTEQLETKSKFYIPVCLKKSPSDVPGFLYAVLTLLLPLAYGYDPGMILAATRERDGVGLAAWAQLIGLLQGLAQGHTLALLLQGAEEVTVKATAASLLGEPTPTLGPLGVPLLENVKAVEKQRQRLQAHWGLLKAADEDHLRATCGHTEDEYSGVLP